MRYMMTMVVLVMILAGCERERTRPHIGVWEGPTGWVEFTDSLVILALAGADAAVAGTYTIDHSVSPSNLDINTSRMPALFPSGEMWAIVSIHADTMLLTWSWESGTRPVDHLPATLRTENKVTTFTLVRSDSPGN